MLFLIHERSARNRTNKNMGFDRDEFDNEINNAQEQYNKYREHDGDFKYKYCR